MTPHVIVIDSDSDSDSDEVQIVPPPLRKRKFNGGKCPRELPFKMIPRKRKFNGGKCPRELPFQMSPRKRKTTGGKCPREPEISPCRSEVDEDLREVCLAEIELDEEQRGFEPVDSHVLDVMWSPYVSFTEAFFSFDIKAFQELLDCTSGHNNITIIDDDRLQ